MSAGRRPARWCRLAAAALALALRAPANADVERLVAGATETTGQARFLEDRERVSIVELAGNYDRNGEGGAFNAGPRRDIGREFFAAHADHYDFLLVFSGFEFDTGDARAFYLSVRNDVAGLGLPIFDDSGAFGSAGRLQGFIDMAALSRYVADPLAPGFEDTMRTATHELLHRWAGRVHYRTPGGAASDALTTADGHWSYLHDSAASVLYGNDWRANGDGTFTSVGALKLWSPLDLYLAGFYRPQEVPPILLIRNAQIPANRPAQVGDTVAGVEETVAVDDIVAAEGAREPDMNGSQRDFRIGLVFLTRPGVAVSGAQLAALNRIREGLTTRFAILTAGRARLEAYPEPSPPDPGSPPPVTGGPPRTGTANVADALRWLRGRQDAAGFWQDTTATRVRDSATALEVLRRLDTAFIGEPPAVAWLTQLEPAAADALARQARVLPPGAASATAAARLAAAQNADGGWGLGAGYRSDSLDTALALLALAAQPGTAAAAIDRGAAFLLGAQSAAGCWASVEGGSCRTSVTATVLRALDAVGRDAAALPAAAAWLAGQQQLDGGFGDSPPTVHDTATVVLALSAAGAVGSIRSADAVAFLAARQTEAGSWDGSVYATALAADAVQHARFPNLMFPAPLTATPAAPRDGDRVVLVAAVRNSGDGAAAGSLVRFYDGDPAAAGSPLGEEAVPPLAAGQSVAIDFLWDTLDRAGPHTLFAVIDPDAALPEASDLDNRTSLALVVQPAPAGVDAAITSPDIAINPVAPDSLPTELAITATVRNLGHTAAPGMLVTLWEGPIGSGSLLGEQRVLLPGRSAVAVHFAHVLTRPGTATFSIQLDRLAEVAEADEANNIAATSIATTPRLDLAVTAADLSLDGQPYLGGDVAFVVTLRNPGTLDSPTGEVRYALTDGTTTRTLQTNAVQLDAGASVTHRILWRVDWAGDLRLLVSIDPQQQIAESDENNNDAALSFTAGALSAANLTVTHEDLRLAPTPGREGQPLALSVDLRNTGGASATGVVVAFFDGDPALALRIAEAVVPSIAPGAVATVEAVWLEIPSPADRAVHVVVDPDGAIAEPVETDNVAFRLLEVLSLPDAALAAGSLALEPAVPIPGQPVTLTATIANLGEQAIAGLRVRATLDGGLVAADQILALVPAGGSAEARVTWTAAASPEPQLLQVVADPDLELREGSEANNTAELQVAAQDADFFVTQRYFSPNGDGIQDATRFYFRAVAPGEVAVEVVDRTNHVTRRFEPPAVERSGPDGGSVEWDGRAALGAVAPDGEYRLRAVLGSGQILGAASTTLDTNRSPLLDALGTPYQHLANLTCGLDTVPDLAASDDESWFVFDSFVFTPGNLANGGYRMTGTGGDAQRITAANIAMISTSADGSRVAWNVLPPFPGPQELWLANGDGSQARRLFANSNWHHFTADGRAVVTLDFQAVHRVPVDGSPPVRLFFDPLAEISDFDAAPSPDRTRIAFFRGFGGEPRELWVLDVESGASRLLGTDFRAASWSRDGRRLAVTSADGVAVFDRDGNRIAELPVPIAPMESVPEYQEFEAPEGPPHVREISTPRWDDAGTEVAVRVSYEQGPENDGMIFGRLISANLQTSEWQTVRWLEAHTNTGHSFHVATFDGSGWVERGVLHHRLALSEQSLDLSPFLPDATGSYRVRIRQVGNDAAHIDQVALGADRHRLAPDTAVRLPAGDDVIAAVGRRDRDLLDLHDGAIEVRFSAPAATRRTTLFLVAREENLTDRRRRPLAFPPASAAYELIVGGTDAPMVVDGEQTAADSLGDRLFDEMTRPQTGHPAAKVQGFAATDREYLYAALDLTVDNTSGGDRDRASLWVESARGWQEFRVSSREHRYGEVRLTRTGQVRYPHQYYEFRVPLTELGAVPGSPLGLRFEADGAALLDDASALLPADGTLTWMPGTRALLYGADGNLWAIRLGEDGGLQPVLDDQPGAYLWSGSMGVVSPTGRRLFVTTPRDADNPESTCFAQGDYDLFALDSLQNLTVDLRRRQTGGGGVSLEGTAADRNLARYALDYARDEAPPVWRPIVPASAHDVFDGRFATWVPPGPGMYLVRLAAVDKAGNARSVIKRFTSVETPSITDVTLTPEAFSPNGDGVLDESFVRYRVLLPVHLEFQFFDAQGTRVRTVRRDHGTAGLDAEFSWDGRDDRGLPVADGIYRMTVQNYEFFVTVDATAPEISDVRTAVRACDDVPPALRPPPLAVDIDPRLEFRYRDAGLSELLVEAGLGPTQSSWRPESVNCRQSNLESDCRTSTLPLEDWVGHRFRVAVTDMAGNRATAEANTSEDLILTHFGRDRIDPATGRLETLQRVGCVQTLFASEYGSLRFALTETVAEVIGSMAIQFQRMPLDAHGAPDESELDPAAWTESDVVEFVPATTGVPQPEMEFVWDLAGVTPGELTAVRFVATDVTGIRHFGPIVALRATEPADLVFLGILGPADMALNPDTGFLVAAAGLDIARDLVLWGRELVDEGAVTDARLILESRDDPRYLIPKRLEPVGERNGFFIFHLEEAQACRHYTGTLLALSPPLPDPTTGEVGVRPLRSPPASFRLPCLSLSAGLEAVPAAECNEAPAVSTRTVHLRPLSHDGVALQLLTLGVRRPDGTVDLIGSVNHPENGRTYDFTLDPDSYPGGSPRLVARVTNVAGEEASGDAGAALEIDRTPLELTFTHPVESQRLCRQVDFEAAIDDESGFAYRLRLSRGGAPEPPENLEGYHGTLEIDAAGFAFELPRATFERFSRRHQAGTLATLRGPGGEVSAQFDAVDNGGFHRCEEVTFFLDGTVDSAEVAVTGVPVSGWHHVSPNGDGFHDAAQIALSSAEPTAVDVPIFASQLPLGNPLQACFAPAGQVRQLATGMAVANTAELAWDGRNDGGAPVADGWHIVAPRFTDACGNFGGAGASNRHCIDIDRTPPTVAITYPRPTGVLPRMIEVRGTATDRTLEEYVLEFGEGADATSWTRIERSSRPVSDGILGLWNTGVLSGEHTIRLTARDVVANASETRVTVTLEPPPGLVEYLEAVPALFSPNGDGRRETTSLRFALAAPARVDLAILDSAGAVARELMIGAPIAAGAHTVAWDGLNGAGFAAPDGRYSVRATARLASDLAFNQTEQVSVDVDRAAPAVEITVPHAGFMRGDAAVEGSIEDLRLLGYTISLTETPDAPQWQELATGTVNVEHGALARLDALPEGDYALLVEAEDTAENRFELVLPFAVDNTPPLVALTAPTPDSLLGRGAEPVAVLGAVEEPHLRQWRLEIAAASAPEVWIPLYVSAALPASPELLSWLVSTIVDGPYVLRLIAVDLAGNEAEARVPIIVDNTAPTAAISTPAPGAFVREPIAIAGTAMDAHLVRYSLAVAPQGSAQFSEIGSGFFPVASGPLADWLALPPDGSYTLRLTAVDGGGNIASAEIAVHVDTHPPAPPHLAGVLENHRDARLSWSAGAEPDLEGYNLYRESVRLNGAPLAGTSYVDAQLAEGIWHYTVRAVDRAGWESEHSNELVLSVDLTPPVARVFFPVPFARVADVVEIRGTAHSQLDFREYRLSVAPGHSAAGPWQLLRRSPIALVADVLGEWDTTALPEGAPFTLRLEAEDVAGNTTAHDVPVEVDNQAPAVPAGLAATVAGTTVHLTWAPNAEPDLRGYLLYRDGRLANATGAVVGDLVPYLLAASAFDDTGRPDGTFVYEVLAMDLAGNLSGPSPQAEATVSTRPPRTVIASPEDGHAFDSLLYVLATSPDTDVASVQFQWRPAGGAWNDLGAADTSPPWECEWDPEGLSHGDYELRAIATDQGGLIDTAPPAIGFVYRDVTSPPRVDALTAQVDGGSVGLAWEAVNAPDLAGYHVDRYGPNGLVRLTAAPLTDPSYGDAGVEDGAYRYVIVAVDDDGNAAPPSDEAAALVHTPLLEQPYTPTTAVVTRIAGAAAAPPATAMLATGEVAGASTTRVLQPVPVAAGGEFSFGDQALEPADNAVIVRLIDSAGNRSKPATVRVFTASIPTAPTGLSATSPMAFQVALSWNANPEADILGYRPLRNGVALLADAAFSDWIEADDTGHEDPDVPANAIDGDPLTQWRPHPDSGAPRWLGVRSAQLQIVTRVELDWRVDAEGFRAPDYDLQGWDGRAWIVLATVRARPDASHRIDLAQPYRSDRLRIHLRSTAAEVALRELRAEARPVVAGLGFDDTAPDGVHSYQVTALNVYAFESAPSAAAEIPIGDTTPPAGVVLSGEVAGTDVRLSWTASASADIARYELSRDGAVIAAVVDLADLRYVDPRPNGTYRYVVVPVDAAGNRGPASNEVVATVSVAAPSPPQGLTVTPVGGGGALDLAWQAGSGQAPALYRVLRALVAGGPYSAIAETTSPAHRDSGLPNGVEQFYVVVALDAGGNASGYSNEAHGAPVDDEGPAAVPRITYPARPQAPWLTTDALVTVAGDAEPGASTTLFRDGADGAPRFAGAAVARSADHGSSFGDVFNVAPDEPAPSPDGRYLWNMSDLGSTSNYFDTVTSTFIDVSGITGLVRWAADGRSVVFTDGVAVRVYRLAEATFETLASASQIDAVVPGPDAHRFAVVGQRTGVYGLWLLDTQSATWRLLAPAPVFALDAPSLRWSPDGNALAYLRYTPALALDVLEIASGATHRVTDQAGLSDPDWAPDSTSLLFTADVGAASLQEQVWRYAVGAGSSQALTGGPDIHRSPQWSPDGDRFAAQRGDGTVEIFDLAGVPDRVVDTPPCACALEWLPNGHLILRGQQSFGYALAGTFEVPNVALAVGDNIFHARAHDDTGNPSGASEPVTITRLAGEAPDLAIGAAELVVLPAAPVASSIARASVVVRNTGLASAPSALLSVVVAGPNAFQRVLSDRVAIPAIPNGGWVVRAWDLALPAVSGAYTLVAAIDPDDAVSESSESNNEASREFQVLALAGPALAVTVDAATYDPGQDVLATLEVDNAGDVFDGRLEAVIEDAAGFAVETILDVAISDLGYGERHLETVRWNTGAVFAGEYQVRGRLRSSGGALVAEAVAPFAVGEASFLDARVASDRPSYLVGSAVRLAATLRYTAGNAVLSGLRARVRILDSTGGELVLWQQDLGDLLPSAQAALTRTWQSGAQPPGRYRASFEVIRVDEVLAAAETLFDLTAAPPRIVGQLALSDGETPVGVPLVATYSVRNTGGTALAQVPVRVRLIDTARAATIAVSATLLDLAPGAEVAAEATFTTGELRLRSYLVVLEADLLGAGGTETATLATAALSPADRTPPIVAMVTPAGGAVVADAATDAVAFDLLSAIAIVEIQVDGAGWTEASLEDATTQRYGLLAVGLSDGPHEARARAEDTWGNRAESAAVGFELDTVPPSIEILGVADGEVYATAVTPIVLVTDAHPSFTLVTLDGGLFASGTAVSAIGDHVLVVSAEDAAGNRARREVRFGIRDQIVVSVALGDVRLLEGDEGDLGDGGEAAHTTARVPVRLSVPAPSVLELQYTTVDGTALAGEDFVAVAGTIAFAAGEREGTIDVRILADDLVERAEDFLVAVTAPAAIAIPDSDAEIAIEDDDVPGLQLTKTDGLAVDRDGDGAPSPGDTLGYTVTARNTGSAMLSGVVVQDPPPNLVSVVAGSVATTQGTIESSDPVRIAVGDLVVGAQAVITFQVEIAATLPAGVEEISNQAIASANEVAALASDDPRTAVVGDATVTSLVAVPNLAALLRARLATDLAGDGVVGAGDEVIFTATLRNTGPIGLTAIVFEAPIPALTELVEAPGSTGGRGVRFEVAELAGGAEVEVWFRVRLAHPWGSALQVVAQGTVRSAELAAVLSDDPAEAGAANPTVVAVSVPSCTVTKVDALVHDLDGHGASAGDTVEYRLALRNAGAAGGTQLRLRDELPIGVDLVAGSVVTTRGVVESEEPLAIAIGTLGIGELIEVRFRVVLDGTPVVLNQAWLDLFELAPIASDDPDLPGPSDPTRTEVAGGGVAEIPALDAIGLFLLAAILAAACLWTLRRSPWSGA